MKKILPRYIFIPCAFVLAAALGIFIWNIFSVPDYQNDGVLRVCLDAGHGGTDSGALSRDLERKEKDDCLSMALAVRDELFTSYPEIEVILTRNDDTFIELKDRCDIANRARCDLFVSFHRNSSQSDASGVEIWISSDVPYAEKLLAEGILERLRSVGINDDRGVRSGTAGNRTSDYYVNRGTKMPGCLIELGFISSENDNLLFDRCHKEYAAAIAEGIAAALIS